MILRPKKQQLLNLLPDALVVTRGQRGGSLRYLTFDDGPDPRHTPALLDLLAEHGIKAGFFLIGHKAERYPALVERIVAEGHRLGNHSYSHWLFGPMPMRQRMYEIARTDRLLAAFDQRERHPMRPPRGQLPPTLLLCFAAQRRALVHWSYDSLDYREPSDEALLARLRDQPPKPGDIVLMHDDHARAVTALRAVLPIWRQRGYTFEALPAEAL